VTGGFLGITDKYWAATAIPDQKTPYTGSFTERDEGATKVYQASSLGEAKQLAPLSKTIVQLSGVINFIGVFVRPQPRVRAWRPCED
jgi:membrane protein insertase Oxa1/YidC/SpoIIIJ